MTNVTLLRPRARLVTADTPSDIPVDSRQTNFSARVDFTLTDSFFDNQQILYRVSEECARIGEDMRRAGKSRLDPQVVMPGICEQFRRLSRLLKRRRPRGLTISYDNERLDNSASPEC